MPIMAQTARLMHKVYPIAERHRVGNPRLELVQGLQEALLPRQQEHLATADERRDLFHLQEMSFQLGSSAEDRGQVLLGGR